MPMEQQIQSKPIKKVKLDKSWFKQHMIENQTQNEQSSRYDTIHNRLIRTIKKNIQLDYPQTYTIDNLNNVLNFYKTVYSQQTHEKRLSTYNYKKTEIEKLAQEYQNQLSIINWFENYRGRKYDGYFVGAKQHTLTQQIKQRVQKSKICRFFQFLIKGNAREDQKAKQLSNFYARCGDNYFVKKNIQKYPIQINNCSYSLISDGAVQKPFLKLIKKFNQNNKQIQTIWFVQITEDGRHIWRSFQQIDWLDIQNLLRFIIQKRSYIDQAPSILLNVGINGFAGEINPQSFQNYQDLNKRIIYETQATVLQLIDCINKYKINTFLNQYNAAYKIFINSATLGRPNIYPQNADNIIDTQCYGPYLNKKFQQSFQKPIVKPPFIFWNSQIIQNQKQENQIKDFFISCNLQVIQANQIFRGSQFDFQIKQYFLRCGKQTQTLFICKTQNNKVLGAYSPLSHQWNGQNKQNVLEEYVADSKMQSFIFSLTNNDKFQLINPQKAVFRSALNNSIQFGDEEFVICDLSNITKKCLTSINCSSFLNNKYIKDERESYILFNGNRNKTFTTKQWQVWKIYFNK